MANKFMLHPDSGKFLVTDSGFAVHEDCCFGSDMDSYKLDSSVGSETMTELFFNATAGRFRITAAGDVGFREDAYAKWNQCEGTDYQEGGVYINCDGIPGSYPSPRTPTQCSPCLPGFTLDGFDTEQEAKDYAVGRSIDVDLPAGQLYWYFNDNPTHDNQGDGTWYFQRC